MTQIIDEIGEEGYAMLKSKIKFGDIIENGWASESNPTRIGIVVKARAHSINCTDGVSFWDLLFGSNSKIIILGNILNDSYEKIKRSRNL